MQAPPPYSPTPKKSKTGLIVGLVFLGFVVCCALPLGGVALLAKKGLEAAGPLAGCAIGFEDARQAIDTYAAKNGGKLPPAANWTAAIRPYLPKADDESRAVEQILGKMDTGTGLWKCQKGTAITYSTEAAGQNLEAVRGKGLIVLFESKTTKPNPTGVYKPFPLSEAPPMMGKDGGWLSSTIDGPTMLRGKGGNVPFTVRQRRGIGG